MEETVLHLPNVLALLIAFALVGIDTILLVFTI
jgi:hypothetical protein